MLASKALAVLVTLAALSLGSVSAAARPCATMALREATRTGALPLSLLALQTRPPSAGFIDSATLPVRVHYENNDVSVRAPEVLALLEAAYTELTQEMGFPAPLPDEGEGGDERFDVYLGFVGGAGALTIASEDVDDADGKAAAYAYIHVSATLDPELMPSFIHHEMAHAVQFALDTFESLMLFEASAVAYERLALPDAPAWADSLEDFQSFPNAPLFTNGIDWRPVAGGDTLYEFGAALFLLYLEQEHGSFDGTLIRQLWEASVQPESLEENEPDWLDALPAVAGAPVEDLLLDFATWRMSLGPWALPDDGLAGGETLSGTALLSTLRLPVGALDGAPRTPPRVQRPHQLGCLAYQIDAEGAPVSLQVDVASLARDDEAARPLGLAWLIGAPAEGSAERGRVDDTGAELSVSLQIPARQTLVLALCDVGPADADELPRDTPVEVRLHNEAVPLYDAGVPDDAGPASDAGTDPPDAGIVCGCQQVPARRTSSSDKSGPFAALRPYAVAVASVVFLLIFAGRARKTIRRRRLYKDDAARRRDP